ncbi:MAG: peptidylprolyl isomerase [Phycisphaerales bacterium]
MSGSTENLRYEPGVWLRTVAVMVGVVVIGVGAVITESAWADEPQLRAERLYNATNRRVMMSLEAPIVAQLSLALIDADGTLITEPVTIRPGRIDLAEQFPALWEIRRTSYLQLLIDCEPIGSALVLQPMLSRMVPITKQGAVRPGGSITTRIEGWYDELHPPPPPPPPELSPKSNADEATNGEAASGDEAQQSTDDQPQRLLTGLRIYAERDVILHTSRGEIRLAMRPDHAPNTVWNFLQLCDGGFYDGVTFHRIVPFLRSGESFVIQSGDPTGTGNGGPGYWLPIEPSELGHDFGVISMARDLPVDSAGSQFFICLSRAGTSALDGHYCSFGYAVNGAETIQSIAAVELDDVARGAAVDPPIIHLAELVPAPPRTPGQGRPDQPIFAQSDTIKPRPPRIPR